MAGNRNKKGCNNAKAAVTIDKDILENLKQSLAKMLSTSNQSDKQIDIDPADLTSVLNLVLQAVSILTEQVETDDQARDVTRDAREASEKVKEANLRVQSDELDVMLVL